MKIQSVSNENTYDLLKLGLKASNLRAKTISNNMANINTKNYKKFGVVFEENLKNNSKSEFKLRTTNQNHYTSNSSDLRTTREGHLHDEKDTYGNNITIQQDKSTSMRSDGNNVDLEIEKVNQAANTLKYNALITSINNKFNGMKSVIK
ncbi:flagellar basal body rod protein FlgB [Clostridium butyricum]|uniref:Flagellar basal body rod protein FlgB n=1 Tax=Clostridium butyricum TaxID=1492 RepID=A0A0A6PZB7_CLOBU|nr:flagellar basal body rod protein FlgB [Clostridium butyricum]KHD13535.1 flagellar basal body rod protein FlgB [Clostridium butyricum]KHD15784.1 flagellar basal body rod protein FlgB [Clostridium butyricum]PPV14677.1 flagellar biosynthesis protein FlgB [Clostridium butyricum]